MNYGSTHDVIQATPVQIEDNVIINDVIINSTIPFTNRKRFIIKVYNILCIILLINSISIGVSINMNAINNFIHSSNGSFIFVINTYLFLLLNCIMVCNYNRLDNKIPKYVYLTLFSMSSSYMLSYISCIYNSINVLISGFITISNVILLTLYAYQTKYDFTTKGQYLIISLFSLLIFGIIISIFQLDNVIYPIIGTIIFSMFIVYDTQLILGGTHKIKFKETDVILAATSLYLDIINMFLYVLQIIGDRN